MVKLDDTAPHQALHHQQAIEFLSWIPHFLEFIQFIDGIPEWNIILSKILQGFTRQLGLSLLRVSNQPKFAFNLIATDTAHGALHRAK
jgi:hypothetical protein